MSPSVGTVALLSFAGGACLAGLLVYAWLQGERARLRAERAGLAEKLHFREEQFAEQKILLDEAEKRLRDTFQSVGAEALRANNAQFLELAKQAFEGLLTRAEGEGERRQLAIDGLVKPLQEVLAKQAEAVQELERRRVAAYRGLEEQIKGIAAAHEKLGAETGRLVAALRRPEQRGRWGELQLRNAVELAGMTAHCDFREQVSVQGDERRLRPDMVVNLPGGGSIVVDSKIALDAYLDALQPDADREASLARHAALVEQHVRQLAAKEYWRQFERTPRLAVMFMPIESALTAALERKPDLHADAMQSHVLIATPTLLVALLRAVAFGWQQEDVARNARDISVAGRELHERVAIFVRHLERVGDALRRGSTAYNEAVGSLEQRVLVSARKLRELHATTDPEITAPAPVEVETRAVTAPEARE